MGLYNPRTGVFALKNSNSSGEADLVFRFGPGGGIAQPITGHWTGGKTTTIGVYVAQNAAWYLKNSNQGGKADTVFQFGPGDQHWLPVTGQWRGGSTTTVGLYDPHSGTWYVRTSNSAGKADFQFHYNPAGTNAQPITGNWRGAHLAPAPGTPTATPPVSATLPATRTPTPKPTLAPRPTSVTAPVRIPATPIPTRVAPQHARTGMATSPAKVILVPANDAATLSAAINTVNQGDVNATPYEIYLIGGTYSFDGNSLPLPDVNRSLNLHGNNALLQFSNGAALTVHASATVNLDHVRLTNNYSFARLWGGVLWNEGQLTLSDSLIENSNAGWQGGAILNLTPQANLTLTRVTLRHNWAQDGGAIRNDGIVTATCTRFDNNSANLAGAVWNTAGSQATIQSSRFRDNLRLLVGPADLQNDADTLLSAPNNYWVSPYDDQRQRDPLLDGRVGPNVTVTPVAASDPTFSSACAPQPPAPIPTSEPTQRAITYNYDGLYRLLTAGYQEYDNSGNQNAGYQYQYSYYYSGNRSTMQYADQFNSTNSTTTWYIYTAANQLDKLYASKSATFATTPTQQYSYDLAGNLASTLDLSTALETIYFYDQAQRMTALLDGPHQQLFTYNYDGLGRRYQQAVTPNGGTALTTRYTLDTNTHLPQVLGERTTTQQTWYLPGIGQEQTPVDTGGNPSGPSVWSYFHTDHLGSVRQLSDAQGSVNYHASYDPYGVPLNSLGTLSTTLGYTGEQTDPSGLLYLRARYLDTQTGMFLSHDPVGGVASRAMSRNGYSYVEGNPVNRTDPSGKCFDPVSFAICLIAAPFVLAGVFAAADTVGQIHYQATHGHPYLIDAVQHINGEQLGNAASNGFGIGALGSTVAAFAFEGWMASPFLLYSLGAEDTATGLYIYQHPEIFSGIGQVASGAIAGLESEGGTPGINYRDEVPSAEIIKQEHPETCVVACSRYMLGKAIQNDELPIELPSEAEMADSLGRDRYGTDMKRIPGYLNEVVGNNSYRVEESLPIDRAIPFSDQYSPEVARAEFDRISATAQGDWMAAIRADEPHAVMVTGVSIEPAVGPWPAGEYVNVLDPFGNGPYNEPYGTEGGPGSAGKMLMDDFLQRWAQRNGRSVYRTQ